MPPPNRHVPSRASQIPVIGYHLENRRIKRAATSDDTYLQLSEYSDVHHPLPPKLKTWGVGQGKSKWRRSILPFRQYKNEGFWIHNMLADGDKNNSQSSVNSGALFAPTRPQRPRRDSHTKIIIGLESDDFPDPKPPEIVTVVETSQSLRNSNNNVESMTPTPFPRSLHDPLSPQNPTVYSTPSSPDPLNVDQGRKKSLQQMNTDKPCPPLPLRPRPHQTPALEQPMPSPALEQSMPSPALEQSMPSPALEQPMHSPILEQSMHSPTQAERLDPASLTLWEYIAWFESTSITHPNFADDTVQEIEYMRSWFKKAGGVISKDRIIRDLQNDWDDICKCLNAFGKQKSARTLNSARLLGQVVMKLQLKKSVSQRCQ